MGGQAQEFTQALQKLYAAAGSPRLADIVAFGARQVRPVKFKDATLSDWFRGESVPESARAVEALTAYLESRATHRPGHTRRSTTDWEDLWAAARTERRSGRGGKAAVNGLRDAAPQSSETDTLLGTPIELCDPLD